MSATVTAGQRPVKLIVGETLQELRSREQRLLGALTEVRGVIRALEEAVGDGTRRETVPPAETDGAPVKLVRETFVPATDAQRDLAVLGALAGTHGCALGTLEQKTAMTAGPLRATLTRLRDRGEVRLVGMRSTARYWLTADLDRYVAQNGHMPDGSAA